MSPVPHSPYAKFIVRTDDPRRYWVGVRLLLPERDPPRPLMLTLLAVSDSLSAGGLFFDIRPWFVVGAGVLLISVLFWLPLVRGITRSVGRMNEATGQIAEGRFDVRLHERRSDELGALSVAINHLAARLAGFVTDQKRFLGDTAHELCSPIARMQVALGILEQRADPKQHAGIEDLRTELEQMSGLVNELLLFSKASLGGTDVRRESVQLRAIADRAVAREGGDRGEVHVEVPGDLWVTANPDLLLRALTNLLRNALRYAGGAGPISLAAGRDGATVWTSVADQGSGVPEEALSKIFSPFYRVDESRSRDTGGAGLGLAIVKTCVESCGGTVMARNREPRGLEVTIRLPAATPPGDPATEP